MSFHLNGTNYNTSTYSDTDWTRQCVGVGSECLCHTAIADSVTQDLSLSFRNDEFTAFMAATIK